MATGDKGGAVAPRSRRARTQADRDLARYGFLEAGRRQKQRDREQQNPEHQARAAIEHAKRVVADPRSTHEEKKQATVAAYHAVRAAKNPKLLEAGIAQPHGVERVVGQTVLDLADAAIHSPGGAYAAGKAVYHDVGSAAHGHPGFKRTRQIGEQMAKGTLEDVRHPLRHPGFTLLDLFAAGSAGAGAASRLGAASRAARAGELGGVAKALTRGPLPGTRTYRYGDLKVETPNSKNALLRAGQKAHARRVNRGGDAARQAKVVGKHLHQEERVTNAAERAPAEALNARGRKLTTPQETALRVVHEGVPIAERIRFHEEHMARAARGSQQFIDHRQKALLLKAAERYVHDVNGRPELRAEFKHLPGVQPGPKRLEEVSGRVDVVNAQRERTLEGTGDLSPEQIDTRLHGPGRVIKGAKYETPTPAKHGVPSPQLERQRAHVARLEQLHERALERAGRKGKPYPPVKVEVPAGERTVTREMTRAEAEARLADIEAKYEKVVDTMTKGFEPGKTGKPIQSMRNARAKKDAKRGIKRKTVTQEARALAEKQLLDLLETSKHPSMVKLNAALDEAARLREALGETPLPGETVKQNGSYGTVTETVKTPASTKTVPSDLPPRHVMTNPIAMRLGGALSVQRDRLAQMERAAAKRVKPTGLVGHENFKGGRSRIPYTAERGKITGRQATYRGGEPRKPGSVVHPFRGGLLHAGNFRDKTSRLVAESGIEAQRYGDVLRLRDKVLQASVEHLPAEDPEAYIAVRVGNVPKPPELKNLETKVEEGVKLNRQERQLLSDAFDKWQSKMFAEPSDLADHKGYRFVRRELLGKLNEPRLLSNVAHYKALRGVGTVVSETNNAVRTALLYMAPKYAIPNISGNAVLNISQQGFRAVPNFYRTLRTVDRDPDLAAKFRSAMGEGFAKQLEPTQGITRAVSEPLAHGWSKIVDEKFRESALLDELRTLGFKTRDELHAAFDDPANASKLNEAVQRAREAIGDYDRLNPVEKDVLRHAIFFYTWLKVSARLSKMYLTERPIQSAAIVGLGRVGEQKQQEELGALPSFAEALFKVGGTREHPVVSNASALNVFTAADLAKSVMNLIGGEHNRSGYQIADNLSPFFAFAVAAITGRDPFTQEPLHGNLAKLAEGQLTGGLPQLALKQRLDRAKTDQSEKFYTYTRGQAFGQFGLGPLGPRGLNPPAAHELASKEHLSELSPAERSRVTVFKRRQRFFEEGQRLGYFKDGKMPGLLRGAFNQEAARQAAYTDATHRVGAKPGTAEYHRVRLEVDAHFLRRQGRINRRQADNLLAWADSHADDKDALKKMRAYLSQVYYQSGVGFLALINEFRKQLEHQGATGLS